MAKTVNYGKDGIPDAVPTYLFDYADRYRENPALAAREWFHAARFGMSISFGLHSVVEKHEDVRKLEDWSDEDYNLLQKDFTCEGFDALQIVQVAIVSDMSYIVMPARYRDGFCLYNSKFSDFSSVGAAANRDLVGEMASACEYNGLGLCLEYSLGYDWQRYANGLPESDQEWKNYEKVVAGQLRELLHEYGPVAAIRFDGLANIRKFGAGKIDGQKLYDVVRNAQPQCLIAFEQGWLGNEDYFTVEKKIPAEDASQARRGFIYDDLEKTLEWRISLIKGSLGYCAEQDGKHLKARRILRKMAKTRQRRVNFLLNTGLMSNGFMYVDDMNTMILVGILREKDDLTSEEE